MTTNDRWRETKHEDYKKKTIYIESDKQVLH